MTARTIPDERVLTSEGHAELRAELERLTTVRRPEVAERLRQALEFSGDLGDNPEYLDAQREQEALEQRIATLEDRLANARVLEPGRAGTARVVVGCWVELEDADTGGLSRFVIVGSAESNPSQGRISIESPVGAAVVGHRPGDAVEVLTPHGRRRLRILAAGTA